MPNMSRIRAAQEATRQKKLRDTPHGRDIELGKTTAAQYSAAYGTVNTPQGGGGHRGRIRRQKAQGENKLMSTQSASVVPDDETASKIKAKRKTGIIKKTATTSKTLGSDVMKNPKKFEAEYQASGTGKAGDTFEAMKTPSKKRKLPQSLRSAGKTGKRRARTKARERVTEKNKKPKTKKTKEQKELEAAYGSPKDTKRMMKGKNLKESWGSKLSKKFRKGK